MNEETVNWETLWRRLEASQAVPVERVDLSSEAELRLLSERARALAQVPAVQKEAGATLDVIEFELAGECYALPVSDVREVCVLKDLTPVPCTPAFVLGIINLRGEIHTIIDLKKFFGLPERGITDLNKVLILGQGDMHLGILADAISGVRRYALADLQPNLPTLSGVRADYMRGVLDGRLALLKAGSILTDPRILVDDKDAP